MYRRCIFCSAGLEANQAVEAFPVGRTVAFDAWKGRLWAVCPRCGRWNLAPLEERWEAVEAAERAFADARFRAQAENVGLARLRDGTRLVRIGEALPGELAAWRYGRRLLGRRRRYLLAGGAALAAAGAFAGGLAVAGTLSGVALAGFGLAARFGPDWRRGYDEETVYRFRSPGGDLVQAARWQAREAVLRSGAGGLEVIVPEERDDPAHRVEGTVLAGEAARGFLRRATALTNARGASRGGLSDALALLERAGRAERYLETVGGGRPLRLALVRVGEPALSAPGALALEMALHEEQERRALDGELAQLEAAWREAEEIAAIADGLVRVPAWPGLAGGGA